MKDAPKVTKIEVKQKMLLHIKGAGIDKVVDIADSDLPARFPKLKDPEYFKKAKLAGGSVMWPDGFQIDLYELVYDWPETFSNKIAGHYLR